MALTATNIITRAQNRLDTNTVPSAATALEFLNDGRLEIAKECECIIGEYSLSSALYTTKITKPTDVIRIKEMGHSFSLNDYKKLDPFNTIEEFKKKNPTSLQNRYSKYFEDAEYFYLYPSINLAAHTASFDGTINDTVTTIPDFDDTSNWGFTGKIILESEVISYSYNDTENNILYGCVRGDEGTTAAAHDGSAVALTATERDVIVNYYKIPADIGANDNVEAIFQRFPMSLVYYICWQARMKDIDDPDSNLLTQYRDFYALYEEEKVKIKQWFNDSKDEYPVVREV